MPLSLPGPSALIGVAGKGVDSIERAISLVPRLAVIVSEVESTLTRVQTVVTAIELMQQRAEAVVERAEATVEEAAALAEQLTPLLQDSLPTLQQLQPILRRITETTSPDEVGAAVTMIDLMPEVVSKFKDDIVPVLDTMGTVAPDVRDLLDVSRELNEMLSSVPGFGRVKRRVEEEQDLQDTYRADEEPPSSPDRG